MKRKNAIWDIYLGLNSPTGFAKEACSGGACVTGIEVNPGPWMP